MPSLLSNGADGGGQEDSERRAKRRRIDAPAAVAPPRRSGRIFAPFRTVGLVSQTPVPFASVPLGKTTFQITTSVGRSLQTYDLKKGLQLVFITGPQTPGQITASSTWADRLLAAWTTKDGRRGVWIFKRGRRVGHLQMPLEVNEDLVQFLVFGSWIVGCCTTKLEVWSASTCEHYTTLEAPFAGKTVLTGGVCTLPTYTNKICAGREDGSVEIWNVSTGKLVYRILPSSSDCGPVSALQPAPAVSVVAIAHVNGNVTLHDVHTDTKILRVRAATDELSPVTSITFRTDDMGAGDDGRKSGIMATASFNSGDIALWDLNNGGRRTCTLRDAHGPSTAAGERVGAGITKIEYLPGQAVMVSSGLDNTLKTWISDETPFQPLPRILHTRSGHAAPVTTLQFLPTDADGADAGGKWLLSASKDHSLWGWSLRRDAQSTELSQGQVQKKAKKIGAVLNGAGAMISQQPNLKVPEIISMACCMNRDGGMAAMPGVKTLWASAKQLKGKSTSTELHTNGWESVVTAHEGEKAARTWYWGRKRAGRWTLETSDGAEVTCVTISPCGTFAVIGSASGGIDMYNLQSGMHRQRYPARLSASQAKQLEIDRAAGLTSTTNGQFAPGIGKHRQAISGLYVDSINRTMISCGKDGKIKFWDFLSGQLKHELDWPGYQIVSDMKAHRPNELIALTCADSCIRILDTETRKVVRELRGCVGEIFDTCFSNDGRWIVASSADSVVRVWDLPTGHMIDAMRLRSPCRALAFSNTGEFLVTAQEDSIGIDVWTNRAFFTNISLRHIGEDDIVDVQGPTASGEGGQGLIDTANGDEDGSDADESVNGALPTLEQLGSEVETLSLVPRNRWHVLLNLDLIRERNKPKEPPKAPEKAPFFLPSLDGGPTNGRQEDDALMADADTLVSERSRVLKVGGEGRGGGMTKMIHDRAYTDLVEYLKTLPPAASDLAIRSLSVTDDGVELVGFVEALTERLKARRDYELVQAWMSVFLRVHGDDVAGKPALVSALREWRDEQRKEAGRIGQLAGYCAGVLDFMRSTR